MTNCPFCEQKLPKGFKPKLQSKRGRPGSIDYAAVRKLKESGMSIRNIAKALNISAYSVFCGTRPQ